MNLLEYDNEYLTPEEIRSMINNLRLELYELREKHEELLQKNEKQKIEFEQLKERYINLTK